GGEQSRLPAAVDVHAPRPRDPHRRLGTVAGGGTAVLQSCPPETARPAATIAINTESLTMRPLLVALALSAVATPAVAADATRPNVVIVFADDLGYGDLGCYGNKSARTPNLDRMAAEGTRWTSFYVPQAVCSASRTALLTGCYPNRLGILGALNPQAPIGISDSEVTLGQLFKSRGYATAIFGKWHLGHHPQFLPPRHGFDEYLGLPYSNDMGPRPNNKNNNPPVPLIDGEKTIEQNPDVN